MGFDLKKRGKIEKISELTFQSNYSVFSEM